MRVYETDTSTCIYSAFGPISPLGSHPLPRKRSALRPSSLLAMPSRRT